MELFLLSHVATSPWLSRTESHAQAPLEAIVVRVKIFAFSVSMIIILCVCISMNMQVTLDASTSMSEHIFQE